MVHLAWYALLVLVNKLYRNLLQIMSVILNIHDFLVVLLCLPNCGDLRNKGTHIFRIHGKEQQIS
jgi:uncharacterized membrane protein YhaH (DUF805 family)